eukprot:364557-Chlamydomonas_euryale.AAC.25
MAAASKHASTTKGLGVAVATDSSLSLARPLLQPASELRVLLPLVRPPAVALRQSPRPAVRNARHRHPENASRSCPKAMAHSPAEHLIRLRVDVPNNSVPSRLSESRTDALKASCVSRTSREENVTTARVRHVRTCTVEMCGLRSRMRYAHVHLLG